MSIHQRSLQPGSVPDLPLPKQQYSILILYVNERNGCPSGSNPEEEVDRLRWKPIAAEREGVNLMARDL